MDSFNQNSYYSHSDTRYYLLVRNIMLIVVVVIQLLGAPIIYGFIKCCCPTCLRKVRPGIVISDDNRLRTVIQPFVIMPPTGEMQVASNHQLPPQYPSAPQPCAPPVWNNPAEEGAKEDQSRFPIG